MNQDNKKDQFEVRDLRRKEKFFVDDLYLNGYAKKCGIYATGVYLSLCRHANKGQQCFPSYRKMAEELNISVKQVGRSLKVLQEKNIIKKIRIGKKLNNRYLLIDKSEWADSPITKDCQSNQPGTDSPLHSKDTQLRIQSRKERPFYRNMLIVESKGKRWCIPKDGSSWLEFCGEQKDIEWK